MRVVAARVRERHLVVADDRVVEIRDPERAVGAELHLHGAKGGIVAREKIRQAHGLRGRAGPVEVVAIDAACDGVAVEKIAAVFGGKLRGGVARDAGDGAGAVIVERDRRREAEAVVLFADALVIAAVNEEIDGLRVGVGGVNVAALIEREAEGIGLPVRPQLETRAIGAEAIGVAAVEHSEVAGAVADLAAVREAVRAVNPAVHPVGEIRGHAVGVLETEFGEEPLARVGAPVAIGVLKPPDAGDGVNDHGIAPCAGAARQRDDADGNVEAVREDGKFPRAARGGFEIGEHAHGVGAELARCGRRGGGAKREGVGVPVFLERLDGLAERIGARGPRIKLGAGDPEAAGGIEVEVERFLDFRLGRDELHLEAGRHVEERALLGREEKFRGRIVAAGIGGEGGGDRGDADKTGGEKREAEKRGAGHGNFAARKDRTTGGRQTLFFAGGVRPRPLTLPGSGKTVRP